MNEQGRSEESVETEAVPEPGGEVSDELLGLGGRMFTGRVLAGTLLAALCGMVLAMAYWRDVGAETAMVWLGVLLVVLTGRVALVALAPHESFISQKGWPWLLLYPLGLNLLTLWFGIGGGWVVWHTEAATQAVMWIVIFSLCAFSVSALALLRSWFLIAPAMALGGPLLALFLKRQDGYPTLIAFSVIFMFGLAFFYRHQGVLLRRFVIASQRNSSLLESLSASSKRLRAEIIERRDAEQRIRDSEQALRMLMEHVRDLIFRVDLDGVVLDVSPSVRELLGYDADAVVGRDVKDLLSGESTAREVLDALRESDGWLSDYKVEVRSSDDRSRWFAITIRFQLDESGEPAAIEGSARDVTDNLMTERALQVVQDRAQITLESIADGVVVTDRRGVVEFLNPVAESISGWALREAQGEPISRVLRLLDRRSGKVKANPIDACIQEGRTVTLPGSLAVMNRDSGAESVVEVTASPMLEGEDDTASGVVVVLHDITRLQDLSRQLSHQAAHDRLTGLLNRAEFEIRVGNAIATANADNPHALLYIDLDQFKVINDTCGHAAGDEALRQISEALLVAIRDSDVLARLGGDEFGVLLERCPVENARHVAETLLNRLRAMQFVWDNTPFELSASVGLVPLTEKSGDLTDVLRAADMACNRAKEMGRDRMHQFRVDDEGVAERKGLAEWVQRLREATEKDRFELHIQPIKPIREKHRLKTGEMLLRLKGEGNELISPNTFLPAAERYHLMPRIDRWVIGRAFSVIASRPESLLSYGEIAINISGQSLNDETFLGYVTEQMEASDVDPEKLCFEITETAAIANLYQARRMIGELKRRGCHFALDDFGSGLSSFQYLKQLNVDKLKIDGAFIRQIASDPVDRAMVQSIIEVAKALGIETVAEYVENGEILSCLEELGVDHAQGFYIAGPSAIV